MTDPYNEITELDELPMLEGNVDSTSAIELTQVSVEVPSEARRREVNSVEQHGHLLKSGPLGTCNDPFCTTCPSYFHYSQLKNRQNGSGRQQQVHRALMRAKDFRSKCMGIVMARFPGILNPHTKVVQWWNKIFVISCLIAIFVDPLFFFLLGANKDKVCIYINKTFAAAVTVFRTLTDTLYFIHMLLQFRVAYVESREVGAGELVDDPKKIAWNYLRGWFMLDVVAVLPLPQVMIWIVVPLYLGRADYAKNLLRVTVLLQYFPRIFRVLPLLSGDSAVGFIFETAWANFVINLFMYLLAGHVVGSSWYLFGLQRVNECLHRLCDDENNITELGNTICRSTYLDCGYGNFKEIDNEPDMSNRSFWLNATNANMCFNTTLSPPIFDYGIYQAAVPVVTEPKAVTKYLYSLFWGFQQISTLAGNQVPSLFVWEVLFILGVTALGLLLFALLIGNMQNFLQSLSRRKLEMQLRRYDAESWMARRKLPIDIRRKVRQSERLKWASTRGVNEEEFLHSLPEDLHKEIRRFLCFGLVTKVGIFQHLGDDVLDAIYELLQPKLYIQGSVLSRINFPLERMMFIIRGNLESCGEDGNVVNLREGDFCGEELLLWCLEHSSTQPAQVPGRRRAILTRRTGAHSLASREVKCLTNVEAFVIEAKDLEKLVRNFSRHMRNPRVQGAIRFASPYWRSWAASCIQVAWRYRKRKLNGGGFSPVLNGSSHWP